MNESSLRPESLANRDQALPVIDLDDPEPANSPPPPPPPPPPEHRKGTRERLREHGANLKERLTGSSRSDAASSPTIQDRLLEKLLQQILPTDEPSKARSHASAATDFVERPTFNITTMSNNFRRFNARIGVVFLFQARAIKVMSWRTSSHTLSFLAVYTFVCLDPYLLAVLPLAITLLAILIPSFMARHPAPPTTLVPDQFTYSAAGPPLAPAVTVKPAGEFSKDFFRNMRDLQNCMDDFSRLHDQIVAVVSPATNFSHEPLSSALFLVSVLVGTAMFLAAHLLPWRLVFLLAGWSVTGAGHPAVQRLVRRTHRDHVAPRAPHAKALVDAWIARDILLDSAPERREVEILELHKFSRATRAWEAHLFAPAPYDPLAPARLAGDRPTGSRFFEDVRAPAGWQWDEKKWALDLWSREWVEERMITGVEVETEGERWVYDLFTEDWPFDGRVVDGDGPGKKGKNTAAAAAAAAAGSSWEEGTDVFLGAGPGPSTAGAGSRRGMWRRRRWVRMVRRGALNMGAAPSC